MTQKQNQRSLRTAAILVSLLLAGFAFADAQSFNGVLTQHNDVGRTGQNTAETILTPQNVNATTFGKIYSYSVDGQVYSQPLYVPNVNLGAKGIHNVVYVETQNDSVYAFDADGKQAAPLWSHSFVNPAAGITPVSCQTDGKSSISCGVYPIYGITSTPVIDPTSGTMYLLARTDNTNTNAFYQTLHAIDITSGLEKFHGPVNVSGNVPGTGAGSKNGIVYFDTLKDIQRAGLLLLNGNVYIGWAGAAHGWIMGYNASDLRIQTAIFNTAPNTTGGGVWGSGNGLVADPSGNIYAAIGDTLFDANTGGVDYGDSLLKLDGNLNVIDYFTPNDQACRRLNDLDLGSAGPMALPTQAGNTPDEVLIAGKGGSPCDSGPVTSRMYLVNQDSLGKYNTTQDQAIEEVVGSARGYWSSPAYWQGANAAYVYSAGVTEEGGNGDYLKLYTVTNGLLSTTPTSQSSNIFPVGATPSVSSNGTSNGIVWAIERPSALGVQPGATSAILYAYDATNLSNMLYNSASATSNGVLRDRGGCANKFAVPTIANGKVYVGTQNELDIFGLLGSQNGPGVYLGNPCWTYPATSIGTTISQPMAVVNNGNSTLNFTAKMKIVGTNSPDFTQTNTCTTLAPGAKCVVTVTFTPSLLGPETANVVIWDNAPGSPHNIYLVGVGKN
jgi:hypothetical protein